MQIKILSIGRNLPAWIDEGVVTYTRRMPRECAVELVELDPGQRVRKRSASEKMAAESKLLRERLERGSWVVALDERGREQDSVQLSKRLERWLESGRNVSLLIGGADGLEPSLRESADERISLSRLTLPHGLVRVIVAEQLYRAWSLLKGHPYHRQ